MPQFDDSSKQVSFLKIVSAVYKDNYYSEKLYRSLIQHRRN